MAADADKRVRPHAGGDAAPFVATPRGRALAAMAAVVADGGYRTATVDRVLARAGIDWPTFVEHFDGLDACFLATMDAGHECAAERARRAVEELGDGADRRTALGPALRAALEACVRHPDVARLCLVEAPVLGAQAVERREAGLQRFVDLLDGLPGARGELTSEMIVGGMYEIVQRRARELPIARLPEIADDLRRLWLPALPDD